MKFHSVFLIAVVAGTQSAPPRKDRSKITNTESISVVTTFIAVNDKLIAQGSGLEKEESHIYPATTRGAKCIPRQAWEENVASAGSSPRDAGDVFATARPAAHSDRKLLFLSQTQALSLRTRSLAVHADASSSVAWIELQSVSLETSLASPEDVDRAR
jgi:hypothetical protein